MIRQPFRVNSASFAEPLNINAKATWPNSQAEAQVAIDANGDITVSYSGFGPDVSVNVNLAYGYFAQILAEPQNADIAKYFTSGSPSYIPSYLPTALVEHPYAVGYEAYQNSSAYGSNGSVDGVINALMLYVWNQLQQAGGMTASSNGAVPSNLSASQLGRIWQIADDVAGMLRGEANGVMFSQFDTAPSAVVPGATPGILYSDSIANNTRDGNDEVDYVVLNRDTANGSFVLSVTNETPEAASTANVTVNVVSADNVLEPEQTALAIQSAIDSQAAGVVGVNWAASPPGLTAAEAEGPVDVRVVSPQEVVARNGIDAALTTLKTSMTTGTDATIAVSSSADFAYLETSPFVPFNIFIYQDGLYDTAGAAEEMTVTKISGKTWTVTPDTSAPFIFTAGATITLADTGGGTGWQTPYWISTSASGDPLSVQVNNAGTPDPYYMDNYVFEITFQGEVHDTPMAVAVVTSTLTQTPTLCLQQVSLLGPFSTVPVMSAYTITFNGVTQIFNYDASSPTGVTAFASAVANWLNTPTALGGPGPAANVGNVTYTVDQADGTFTLIFPAGVAEPTIQIVATPVTVQGQATPTWSATVAVTAPTTPVAAIPTEGTEIAGNAGTPQADASVAMTPDGDYTMTWTQYNDQSPSYNTNVYYRQFAENTVTVGPQAESFELASPTAPGGIVRLESPTPQEVTAANLNYIIVTFDENMMTTGASSVTNPQNWALLDNGSQMVGGIQEIFFGLNEAAALSQDAQFAGLGLPAAGSNKYEAVLILNGTGAVNPATGLQSLVSGDYTITALNSLRDAYGNPLGRNGYTPQGYVISRSFDVLAPTGGQSQVSGPATTVLASAVAASDTTITVSSAAGFPVGSLPFNIVVGNETMTVTAVGGAGDTAWTVTRGVNYTSSAAYLAGATVSLASAPATTTTTTLAAAVTLLSPTITVPASAAASFPVGNVPFNIVIDGETMTVTAISGTTWSVTRGVNNTVAALHSLGATVSLATAPAATTTALADPLTTTSATITVTSAAAFPSGVGSLPFNIVIDDETMTVTSFISGTTWAVSRGANGSAVTAHNAGAIVSLAGVQAESPETIASDANGDAVVVWASNAVGQHGVYAELYLATWKTALASAVASATSGATGTIKVASAAGFPTGNLPFNILIDSEVMTVTAVSGAGDTTWTVTRGVNGTIAAAHAAGAIVFVSGGRATALSAGAQITVANDPSGATEYGYASVARSADGNFVVTWSELNAAKTTNWDVFARWYTVEAITNAAGTAIGQTGVPMPTFDNATGGPFRVNSTVANIQRYSTVSMDNQGDAVIVWQSLGQNGAGYGVYMQRFNPSGVPVGGTDQVEALTFTNDPVGSFTLEYNGQTTASIPYNGNTKVITGTIQSALAAIGLTTQVTAISSTEILITLIGNDAAQALAPVYLAGQTLNSTSGAGRDHFPAGHGEGEHGGNAGQRPDREQRDVARRLHGPERDVRRHVGICRRGRRRRRERDEHLRPGVRQQRRPAQRDLACAAAEVQPSQRFVARRPGYSQHRQHRQSRRHAGNEWRVLHWRGDDHGPSHGRRLSRFRVLVEQRFRHSYRRARGLGRRPQSAGHERRSDVQLAHRPSHFYFNGHHRQSRV